MSEKTGKVSLLAATVIGINAMIGAGIFAMPALLAPLVGPASILAYALSSIVILSIVFSLGKLSMLYPTEGWGYAYPARWGGHITGMISSTLYLAGVIIAMGFLSQQAGVWLRTFIPLSQDILGASLLCILVLLVLAGAQVSAWGQYIIAAGVLIPLVISSIFCLTNVDPALLTPFMPHGVSSVFNSLPTVLFSLLGFESIASLYSVVENPQKNVPKAAILAVFTVIALYVLFVLGVLSVVPVSAFKSGVNQTVASVIVSVLPHYQFLTWFMSIGAFFAIVGTIHSMIWSIGVLLYDVVGRARSGMIVDLVERQIITPRRCVLIVGALTLYCTLCMDAKSIVPITPLFIVPAYTLSLIALLCDRSRTMTSIIAFVSSIVLIGYSASGAWAALCS